MRKEGDNPREDQTDYSKIITTTVIILIIVSLFFYLFIFDSPLPDSGRPPRTEQQYKEDIQKLIIQTEEDIHNLKQDMGETP